MSKKELTKAEYMRLYMRCRTRGMNIANLRGNDLKVFVAECMESEKKASRQSKLTKSERLKKATKLFVKNKRREKKPKKPQERRIGYINVTPRHKNPLQDLFMNPSQGQDPKKAELDEFMDEHGGSASYEDIMNQLGVEVKSTHHSENEAFFDERTQFGHEISGELNRHIQNDNLIEHIRSFALSQINTPKQLAFAKQKFQRRKREFIKKLKEIEQNE